MKRVIWLVLDGVGCGAMPDCACFGDDHPNTLLHTSQAVGGLSLPTLERLGLGCIPDTGVGAAGQPLASFGRMAEQSPAKDTVTGHWEMCGVKTTVAPKVWPHGFPPAVLEEITHFSGRGILCNQPASGTEIIAKLGQEHVQTGKLIIYTSADSVLQIAAHEGVVPLEKLYALCAHMREFMMGEYAVGRIIARPFTGENGHFVRTVNRHDWALPAPGKTILDCAEEAGFTTVGVGKIGDIFSGRGLVQSFPDKGNEACMKRVMELCATRFSGILMANLVDFDMLYGHRRDPVGMAGALARIDEGIGELCKILQEGDALLICADHGCDPTHGHTDHTREYVPLLWMDGGPARSLGTLNGFQHAATLAAGHLGLDAGALPWIGQGAACPD
nr:phosphopentomutase [bacterium]